MCAEFSFLSHIHALWFITLSAFVLQTCNSQRGRTLMMPPCDNLSIIDEDIAYIGHLGTLWVLEHRISLNFPL